MNIFSALVGIFSLFLIYHSIISKNYIHHGVDIKINPSYSHKDKTNNKSKIKEKYLTSLLLKLNKQVELKLVDQDSGDLFYKRFSPEQMFVKYKKSVNADNISSIDKQTIYANYLVKIYKKANIDIEKTNQILGVDLLDYKFFDNFSTLESAIKYKVKK